ncbi:hypothetical protein BGZ99_003188 [Dissophora globulifera]|uniref:GCS light chain n=1 Tax=Dissophora globulifera TaxID=979702 RepID=A0A9P6RN14_9FUNG|nr:hypothetical protein BGZ99_003188 [Dissophora globulifera]
MTAVQAPEGFHSAVHGAVHATNGKQGSSPRSRTAPVAFALEPFSHLTLYTGNTMRTGTTGLLNTTQKKSNQELVSAVEDTLNYSLETAHISGTHITIADQDARGPLDSDRAKYDITVKLFFLSPAGVSTALSVQHVDEALGHLDAVLHATDLVIDHFILAIPNQSFDENELDDAELEAFAQEVQQLYLPVWKRLSDLRTGGRIGRLGVTEFSKQQLVILKEAALAVGAVAPEIDQVNLHDCCVLPKELIEYAKAEGIELLTHGDTINILPKSTLATLLQPHLPVASELSLSPNFVLKYSAVLGGRGLITRKGYIVDAVAA